MVNAELDDVVQYCSDETAIKEHLLEALSMFQVQLSMMQPLQHSLIEQQSKNDRTIELAGKNGEKWTATFPAPSSTVSRNCSPVTCGPEAANYLGMFHSPKVEGNFGR